MSDMVRCNVVNRVSVNAFAIVENVSERIWSYRVSVIVLQNT